MTIKSDSTDGVENFLDFKLTGGRFELVGFPLDAMGELVNYQRLLLEVAKDLWRLKNPTKKSVPAHFEEKFRLGLKMVQDGSARPIAVRPRELDLPNQPDILTESKEFINRAFERIVQDFELPAGISPETISAFRAMARELTDTETYHFREGTERVVKYDRRLRKRLLAKLDEPLPRIQGVLVGNIKSLDPYDQKFVLLTTAGDEVTGIYSDHARFGELHDAMDVPKDAAWVRLWCEYDIKRGKRKDRVQHIYDVGTFEMFDIQKGPLSNDFAELASLNAGWLEGDGEVIDLAPIEFARDLLAQVAAQHLEVPAVFPTEDGGVQLEWLSPQRHMAITVEPDLKIEAFVLNVLAERSELESPVGILAVADFIRRHIDA